jgi:WD40 repeat protein
LLRRLTVFRLCGRWLLAAWLLIWGLAIRADSPERGGPVHTDLYGDPLPVGAIARLGTARFRPGKLIRVLAFAPDGRTLAGTVDSRFIVWDVASGRELRAFPREWDFKNPTLAYSPDGKMLAFCSSSSSVRLCDAITYRRFMR